eukprot:scaffold84790_cov49-Prasinocladus_malaysianus.AAC.2
MEIRAEFAIAMKTETTACCEDGMPVYHVIGQNWHSIWSAAGVVHRSRCCLEATAENTSVCQLLHIQ